MSLQVMIRSLTMSSVRKFIDIGANLTDDMYKGIYHGSKKHEPDITTVLERCWNGGLEKIIITGGCVNDIKTALKLAKTDDRLYMTVGCHPTRCNEFVLNPSEYLNSLKDLLSSAKDKVVAIGECGLDYDRLHFCEREIQKTYFEYQLQLCEIYNLPLFLHCRAAWDDFFCIMSNNSSKLRGGVVHSFDGSIENMKRAIEMGLYIGINGCSLKTEDNLSVVASIPADRLLIETDCPWCEIRPAHASFKYVKTQYPSNKKEKFVNGAMVKGRNEPINLIQVLEVLASVRNEDEDTLCKTILENSNKLFFNAV